MSAAAVGYRFPRAVIAVAVRRYLRYGLSYRDADELLTERGIEVDHVTIYRWVHTFTPEFVDCLILWMVLRRVCGMSRRSVRH